MTKISECLIVPAEEGLIAVEGLEFAGALVPCSTNFSMPTSQALAQISITAESQRSAFFGGINDPDMLLTAEEFVRALGDNDERIVGLVSEAIIGLAREAATITQDESVWLELRGGSEEHPFYNTPRWHPDGTYFDPFPKKALYKFATALVGRSTRFSVAPDREKFEQTLFSHPDSQSPSPEGVKARIELGLHALVDEIPPSKLDDAAFFLTGHDAAVIHSEPVADGPRLFMFTLGGPLEKIKELGLRRK